MADQRKVKVLDNSFFRETNAAKKQSKHQLRIQTIHRRRLFCISIFVVLIGLFCGYQIVHANLLTASLETQVRSAHKKLNKEKQTRSDLKQQVKQLGDQDYLQKLIRDKYYYSKDGETIYSLPSNKTDSSN
ncbi:FtsB family cell division protein [Liquorilactobacillus oeni]|uniref:Cell division protein DIVIC n=1 Tax=Liquorilactobacillus oeni DSM 19972 TaxID=1423777 RepID=A0A0R1MEE9_9LACO|nr:septum formation initiator family protein [Liquorilactobacillus oeni]KRL06241.1 hypothetical protein FD46_GL000243 [Liquorilactobacillus oeni DSM 19972]